MFIKRKITNPLKNKLRMKNKKTKKLIITFIMSLMK